MSLDDLQTEYLRESPEESIKRLSQLTSIEYERIRAEEAKRIGVRVTKLDTMVTNERHSLNHGCFIESLSEKSLDSDIATALQLINDVTAWSS